jgi:hypothetical protein
MPERTPTAIRPIGPLLMVLLAGCAGQEDPPTPPTTETPEPLSAAPAASAAASFDLALVKSEFTRGCANSRIDEAFCDRVDIDRWKASGMTLVVPTSLRGADRDTARSICFVIQDARFEDPEGSRLGFDVIVVLDMYGLPSYDCWKPRF